jgi:hypothetical protein
MTSLDQVLVQLVEADNLYVMSENENDPEMKSKYESKANWYLTRAFVKMQDLPDYLRINNKYRELDQFTISEHIRMGILYDLIKNNKIYLTVAVYADSPRKVLGFLNVDDVDKSGIKPPDMPNTVEVIKFNV